MEPTGEVAVVAVVETSLAELDGGVLEARVGDTILVRLGRAGPAALRGAPPGAYVRRDGVFDYDLTAADVGRWEITVRHRHFVLAVSPSVEDPAPVMSAEAPEPAPAPVDDGPVTVGRVRSPLTAGCAVSLGLAAGVQAAAPGASPWQSLGPLGQRSTASPTGLLACTTNTPLAPVFGFEVAPFATIREEAAPLTWWAGLQVRVADVAAGPYATRNHWGYGLGARAGWRAGRWGGPELRVSWVPPGGGSGRGLYVNEDAVSAGLAWTIEGWL